MLKWCFVLILSELIRRHVENKGHYETFGYAGFLELRWIMKI
jgi:uncharacterized protein YbcC (UPF0753/DUF2309 family)